jgi:hypothetical protein
MHSTDERVYKIICAMAENQLLTIINEVKTVNIANQREVKTNI